MLCMFYDKYNIKLKGFYYFPGGPCDSGRPSPASWQPSPPQDGSRRGAHAPRGRSPPPRVDASGRLRAGGRVLRVVLRGGREEGRGQEEREGKDGAQREAGKSEFPEKNKQLAIFEFSSFFSQSTKQ